MASFLRSLFTSIAIPLVSPGRRPALAAVSPISSPISVRFLYKLKTHSGAKKRFFPTSNGNFKRWQVGRRHLNLTLTPERSNRLGKSVLANNTQKRMLRRAMPYV